MRRQVIYHIMAVDCIEGGHLLQARGEKLEGIYIMDRPRGVTCCRRAARRAMASPSTCALEREGVKYVRLT